VFSSTRIPDSQHSVKKSNQWSRSLLDLMVVVTSQFRLSQIRKCCIVSSASPYHDSRNSDKGLDQRSRSDLVLTAAIES
jgi:hypothetical protein